MTNIFDKLGVLLRSKVGGLADDLASPFGSGTKRGQVDKLRKQVNSAVEYEENIQKQIRTLEAEITDLNHQVDRAVEQGQDATARHILTTLQRREQHLTLLQGDLETHQMILNELILQVNQLDAVVSDQSQPVTEPVEPRSDVDDLQNRVDKFQQVIHDSQSRINELGEKIKAKHETQSSDQEATDDDIDDELEKRRNRLMKR